MLLFCEMVHCAMRRQRVACSKAKSRATLLVRRQTSESFMNIHSFQLTLLLAARAHCFHTHMNMIHTLCWLHTNFVCVVRIWGSACIADAILWWLSWSANKRFIWYCFASRSTQTLFTWILIKRDCAVYAISFLLNIFSTLWWRGKIGRKCCSQKFNMQLGKINWEAARWICNEMLAFSLVRA